MFQRLCVWGLLCLWVGLGRGCPKGCIAERLPAPAPPPAVAAAARTETVPCDILFLSGSASLTGEGHRRLDVLAPKLAASPGPIDIRVYADDMHIGHATETTRRRLTQIRADALVSYFSTKGVPRERMAAYGMGTDKAKPRPQARRAEITWEE